MVHKDYKVDRKALWVEAESEKLSTQSFVVSIMGHEI